MVVVVFSGCSRVPRLIEYDEQSNAHARSAPLVIVGLAGSDERIGRPVPSRRDPNYPMQLHRVKVKIENVLRGSIADPTISVYYFGFAGGFDGPRPLGFGGPPSRRILWLQRDHGTLRMACDGWDYCTTFVRSGAHLQYKADPAKPLGYALVDILLTRGEGEINDLQFANQIQSSLPSEGSVLGYGLGKLRQLALTESSNVKNSACELLWIETQDRIDSSLRQETQDSLRAANCNCRMKPDGNVLCE
jgi:hypothetical protein